MKLFNAFQAVCMFTAWPWLIQWLGNDADFYGAGAVKWAAIVAYVVGFFTMVSCVRAAMEPEAWQW